MTTTTRPSMEELGAMSTLLRQDRARIRRALQQGSLELRDVLIDPPASIVHMPVLDVMRMVRVHNLHGNTWQQQVGRRALIDRVNLLVRVGHASARTIEWAITHGPRSRTRLAA